MTTGTATTNGWSSPLREVELAAQARAKSESLDMESDGAVDRLRTLVAEEVDAWRSDYRRGRRHVDIADPALAVERAVKNLAGYGPLESLLADPDVWEIMINGPASIFAKRHSGAGGYHSEVFHDDEHVVRVLTKILDDSSRSHRKLDPSEGLQDAQLNSGARLHIVHSDVGRDGHLLVNIRKFSGVVHKSLGELIGRGMLDVATARFLQACVRSRLSILVAGAPGSGKTTLLSCLASELDPALRVVVAEEVFETDVSIRRLLWGTEKRKCWWRPSLDNRIAARDGFSTGRRSAGRKPAWRARARSVRAPQIEATAKESGVVNAFVNACVNGASASSLA